jgi:predicted nucleic acid-binding protein
VIRAVIDTNVLVSGLLSPAGNEALIVLAIHQGLIRPCFSEAMMQNMPRCWRGRSSASSPFRDNGAFVVPRAVAGDLPDLDDAKFVHCAETAQAEYLVCGEPDLHAAAREGGWRRGCPLDTPALVGYIVAQKGFEP